MRLCSCAFPVGVVGQYLTQGFFEVFPATFPYKLRIKNVTCVVHKDRMDKLKSLSVFKMEDNEYLSASRGEYPGTVRPKPWNDETVP